MPTRTFKNSARSEGGATPRPAGVDFIPASWLNDIDAHVFDGSSFSAYSDPVTPPGLTGTAVTITPAAHHGRPLLLNETSGTTAQTVTLPPATGSGAKYEFKTAVNNTGGVTIQVDGTDATMDGQIITITNAAYTVFKASGGGTDQTGLTDGTDTLLTVFSDGEVFDFSSNFNGTIFTAPYEGEYQFSASIGVHDNGSSLADGSLVTLLILVNGTSTRGKATAVPSGAASTLSPPTLVANMTHNFELEVGDTVAIHAHVDAAGATTNITVEGDADQTYFTGKLLTPEIRGFKTTNTTDTITLDGTNTGGEIGDTIELIDYGTNTWLVDGRTKASSVMTEVVSTPFSAAV
jgi:hypothetical protein